MTPPLPVVGMNAGSAEFDHPGAIGSEGSEVELRFRVRASRFLGPLRVKEAVGSEALAGAGVRDDEMPGKGIELVAIGNNILLGGSGRTKSKGEGPQLLSQKNFRRSRGPPDGKGGMNGFGRKDSIERGHGKLP